jgi:hypothetical protein
MSLAATTAQRYTPTLDADVYRPKLVGVADPPT